MVCKIAVVDSGVDSNLYCQNIIENLEINEHGMVIPCTVKEQRNKHGNLCCSALLSINPGVQIISLKVLDSANRCTSKQLLHALEYLSAIDINIINLSLATSNQEFLSEYEKITGYLRKQNKLLICSLANSKKWRISLPAMLIDTIGVQGKMFIEKEDYWYNRDLKVQCIADNKPVLLKRAVNEYEFFGGNSKAAAVFSGIAAKVYDKYKTNKVNDIEEILVNNAKENQWIEIKDEIPDVSGIEVDKQIEKKLKDIVSNIFEITKENRNEIDNFKLKLTKDNAVKLIQEIETQFNFKLNYDNINYFWLYSFCHLYYYVNREIEVLS